MALQTALVVLAGGFVGGFVSGLAGFGTGLVGLGLWLQVLPPVPASVLVVVCSVASQAQTIPVIWHAIDRARLWPMLAAGLVGVPVGAHLLADVDPAVFRLCVGLFLVGFSLFMLLVRVRRRLVWGGRLADAAVGLAGGVLGGLAGLSGPLPTVWATLRGWGKDERRSVFQTFNLVILLAALVSYVATGVLGRSIGWLLLVALPGTVVGSWIGVRAYGVLSDRVFHKVVLVLLLLSGMILVWGSV